MSFDYEKFIAPYREHLNSQQHISKIHFFDRVIPLLVEKNKPLCIVETGCMHLPLHYNAGAMTMVFADLIKNWTGGKMFSVDISPDAISKCKELTLEFADHIEYVNSDSVKFLKSFQDKREIDLLFLDSYDLNVFDPSPSYIHHLRELSAVYEDLNEDVIVGVDDNFLPGTVVYWKWNDGKEEEYHVKESTVGKGTLIDRFLKDQSWKKISTDIVGVSNIFIYKR